MTKNDIAKNVNFSGEIVRTMEFDNYQNYEIGNTYKLGSSWATTDISSCEFLENKKYTYVFHCKKCSGHKLDYDNLTNEEMSILDTSEDAWRECEVLVDSEQMFKILSKNEGFVDDNNSIFVCNLEVKAI